MFENTFVVVRGAGDLATGIIHAAGSFRLSGDRYRY